MYGKHNAQLTVIIYDGITNSVFASQVLTPLLERIEQTANLEITVISFEKKIPPAATLKKLLPVHDKLHFVLARKLPFFGKHSLKPAVWQLKRILKKIPCDTIMTRGPLAGWIALTAVQQLAAKFPERLRKDAKDFFPPLLVQARGLCAEEHRFATQWHKPGFFQKQIASRVCGQLKEIEFEVYRNKRRNDYPGELLIEAVSPALSQYLVDNFRADETKITIAQNDIPKTIAPKQRDVWRTELRKKLNIPHDARVYCYNGSAKPWQCAAETLFYFQEQFKKDSNSFLLILSGDKDYFAQLLADSSVPQSNYHVTSVSQTDLYKYLAACDVGLLFRHKDIINWVARPTKMLDYQAAGLKIEHNDTVAWLAKASK